MVQSRDLRFVHKPIGDTDIHSPYLSRQENLFFPRFSLGRSVFLGIVPERSTSNSKSIVVLKILQILVWRTASPMVAWAG